MASKKTVTAENLVQLGAERLADLLLLLAEEQPTIKRRLRLELAGEAGAEIIAAEIGKRLMALRSARSFTDWQRRPEFVRDLDLTRAMIAVRLFQARPDPPAYTACGQLAPVRYKFFLPGLTMSCP